MAKSLRELFLTKQFELYGTDSLRIVTQGAVADPQDLIAIGAAALGAPSRVVEFISPHAANPSSLAISTQNSNGKIGFDASPEARAVSLLGKVGGEVGRSLIDAALAPENLKDKFNTQRISGTLITIGKKQAQNLVFGYLRSTGIARPDIRRANINLNVEELKTQISEQENIQFSRPDNPDNKQYSELIKPAIQAEAIDSPLTTTQLYRFKSSPTSIVKSLNPVVRAESVIKKYTESDLKTPLGTENVSENTLERRRGIYSDRDAINQVPLLSQEEYDKVKYNNSSLDDLDLIPFKIKDLHNNKLLLFRCTVTNWSEQFNPRWNSAKYIGRPFNYYMYDGLERQANLSFKLYALNAAELKMMWNKLNYLIGMVYPADIPADENKNVYMTPPFLQFTFGNVLSKTHVLINSLTYTIPDDATWETGGDTRIKKNSLAKFSNLEKEPFPAKLRTGTSNNVVLPDELSALQKQDEETTGQYNRDDSFPYNEEFTRFNDYKLPKIVNIDMSLTILQNGLPTIGSQHFGFKPDYE